MQPKGYIDLQVNGYMGVDFSREDLTEESCAKACRGLITHGTGAFLPTVITSSEEIYKRNFKIIANIINSSEFDGKVLGIHAEGPFISQKPGAVGAHNPKWTQKADLEFFDKMQEWAQGNIKLLTVAAEIDNAEQLTQHAVQQGVSVSLGHQDAELADLERLAQAGATLLTHLGNGMPNMVHRHYNQLLAGLAIDELTAMIITDGHHLPAHVIKAILKAKGTENVIITSDASPIAGMPPGKYEVLGNPAILEENGLLHNPEKQCLVGSSATIVECVQYLESLDILSVDKINQVSHTNPLAKLSL